MPSPTDDVTLRIDDVDLVVTHASKLLIPDAKVRKLDLVQYYLAVAAGALRGAGQRPCVLVRYPDGIAGVLLPEARAGAAAGRARRRDDPLPVGPHRRGGRAAPTRPTSRGWRTSPASSCIRIRCAPTTSIIPTSCASTSIRCPASRGRRSRRWRASSHAALTDSGLTGWPKTSGSRGIHVLVRIERRWTFDQVRRAALALAREVERRAPGLATSAWWKEERHGVFVDYNQNAKDRTVASAYSVRAEAGRARVDAARLGRARRVRSGRLHAVDDADALRDDRRPACGDRRRTPDSLDALLALSARHEAEGQGDAPWPPHYRKGVDEPTRAPPSHGAAPRSARPRADAADRDRPGRTRGGSDRRGRRVEGGASRGRGASRAGATCWSTACAAVRRCRTACGSTCVHVPGAKPDRRAATEDADTGTRRAGSLHDPRPVGRFSRRTPSPARTAS